jgi:tetratricopeptide (TPR) repeat protein
MNRDLAPVSSERGFDDTGGWHNGRDSQGIIMRRKNLTSALDLAQDMAYAAWHAPTAKRRVELAKKALELSPRCADAYVLLAEHSPRGSDKEIDLWQHAVTAGEEALGPAGFMDFAGAFWGFLETRPYMRARFGLARALWRRGKRDDAINHLQEMLGLNPDDNQGVRSILTAYLAEAGRDDDLRTLMARYPDEHSAVWAWTGALLAFREAGDGTAARKRLDEAMAVNPHVPAYLCDEQPMPTPLPMFLSPGAPTEAVHYVAEHRKGWECTPAALEWVRAHVQVAKKPVRTPRKSQKKTTPR